MITIKIADEYTATPGARYKADGPYSGEEFRERFLEPRFSRPSDNEKITIDLDGTAGYGTSFLEEAFGGLARKVGKERCIARFEFISIEEPLLIDEIIQYINES